MTHRLREGAALRKRSLTYRDKQKYQRHPARLPGPEPRSRHVNPFSSILLSVFRLAFFRTEADQRTMTFGR
jgi:hypothetical protein